MQQIFLKHAIGNSGVPRRVINPVPDFLKDLRSWQPNVASSDVMGESSLSHVR